MKRRSILFKRSTAVALLLSLMLLQFNIFAPRVEATYTYIADPTYPEIGWMDVKQVGWDFNPKELLLYVQYQANIPNKADHYFRGDFFLDTDQNPTTGSGGFEYYVHFWCQGDGNNFYYELQRWDAGSASWVFVKTLGKPFWTAGGDTVELGVPLADIGSPTGVNICYSSGGGYLYDRIQTKYTYNTASEDRSITVDGNPVDWADDIPDITDPTGDVAPSWADVTKFYTTDYSTAKKLYIRMDLAAAPPSFHPEEGTILGYDVWYIYFDTDRDPSTGYSIGTVGAEYRLWSGITTLHTSRSVNIGLYQRTGTSWTLVSGATLEKAFAGSCLEVSLLLSDIGVTGSTLDIYIDQVYVGNNDHVPNSGTFTATKTTSPSRKLSEASTEILSATASSVYFIYANPNRMVSAAGPWQAAFAAYDATAAGFIYGLCANSQVICYDSNPALVVAKEPSSNPPFNYGKFLLSSMPLVIAPGSNQGLLLPVFIRVIVVGGPTPNWVVDYYERTGQTPLKLYRGATDLGFQTQAGTVAYTIPKTTDFAHNDLFVVMAFQDTNGNFVLIMYGMEWRGTFAGGVLFKEVISKNLASYTGSAYVYRWKDAGAMDGVPQTSEITQVYPPP